MTTSIVVWIAVAVFATAEGHDSVMSEPMSTEAECQALLVTAGEKASDAILALGQSCVKVTVSERVIDNKKPKISTPKPNSLGDTGVRSLKAQ